MVLERIQKCQKLSLNFWIYLSNILLYEEDGILPDYIIDFLFCFVLFFATHTCKKAKKLTLWITRPCAIYELSPSCLKLAKLLILI